MHASNYFLSFKGQVNVDEHASAAGRFKHEISGQVFFTWNQDSLECIKMQHCWFVMYM